MFTVDLAATRPPIDDFTKRVSEALENGSADDALRILLDNSLLVNKGFSPEEIQANPDKIFYMAGQLATHKRCKEAEENFEDIIVVKEALQVWMQTYASLVELYKDAQQSEDSIALIHEKLPLKRVWLLMHAQTLDRALEMLPSFSPNEFLTSMAKREIGAFIKDATDFLNTRPLSICAGYFEDIQDTLSLLYQTYCVAHYGSFPALTQKGLRAFCSYSDQIKITENSRYSAALYELHAHIAQYPNSKNEIKAIINSGTLTTSETAPILYLLQSNLILSDYSEDKGKELFELGYEVLKTCHEWRSANTLLGSFSSKKSASVDWEFNGCAHRIQEIKSSNYDDVMSFFGELLHTLKERNGVIIDEPCVHVGLITASRRRPDSINEKIIDELHQLEMENLKQQGKAFGLTLPTGKNNIRSFLSQREVAVHALILEGKIEGSFMVINDEACLSDHHQSVIDDLKNAGAIPTEALIIFGEVVVISDKIREILKKQKRSGSADLNDAILNNITASMITQYSQLGKAPPPLYAVAYVGIDNGAQISHRAKDWTITDIPVEVDGAQYVAMFKLLV